MALVGVDSQVVAGTLKNSVRVGDRSKMHIVRAPRPGEKITLPSAATYRTRAEPTTRPARARTSHDWFWALHNPRAGARATRWQEAIESIRARPAPIVNRRMLRAIASEFRDQIATAARKHRVSEALILAVIAVESAGKPKARSNAGAEGLMQLIPATALRFGVQNSFDPVENIDGGAAYLNWLLGTFKGDILLALAGYNAGEGAVMKHKGVPPYAETRDYVVKVLDALVGAEELCLEPPAGPRRSCLWRVQDES